MNYLIEIVNDTLKGFNFVNGLSYTAFTNTRSIEIKFHGKNPVNGAYIFRINKNAYEALVKTNGFIGNDITYKNQNSPFNPGIKDGLYYIKYLMDYKNIAYNVIAKLLYSPLDTNYNPYRKSIPKATNQEATLGDPYDVFVDLTDPSTEFNLTGFSNVSKLMLMAYPNFIRTEIMLPILITATDPIFRPTDITTDPIYGVDAIVAILPDPFSVTIDGESVAPLPVPTISGAVELTITTITPGTGYISGQTILLTIEITETTYNTKKYITYPYIFQAP